MYLPGGSQELKEVKKYLVGKGHMCMESGTYDILYWGIDPFVKDCNPIYVPFKVNKYKIVFKKIVF